MLNKPLINKDLFSSSFDILDKEIKNCFLHAEGPGVLPSSRTNRKIEGIISPYGKYREMGHVCAWSYKEIGESKFPDVFIVLGKGNCEFSTYLFSGWETPFGVVNVDKEKGHELADGFPFLKNDMNSFEDADSIISQLPFLQFVNKDKLHDLTIIPLLIGSRDYDACIKLGEIIGELGEKYNICVVGGCNLFGDVIDNALLNGLKNIDVKKIRDVLNVNQYGGDLLVFVEAMKSLFKKEGKLLNYIPGYASMRF